MIKAIFNTIFFCLISFIFAVGIKSEDLGSLKKRKKQEQSVGYAKLNIPSAKKEPVQEDKQKKEMASDSNVDTEASAPFYKRLGKITIRASENYVYIRAAESAVIMDAAGKIIIDSAQDLVLTSNRDILLKAKKILCLSLVEN